MGWRVASSCALPASIVRGGVSMGFFDFLKQIFGTSPVPPPRPSPAFLQRPLTEDERWPKALSDFGYPYNLVAGESAVEAFKAEQQLGRQQGFTPIILVPGLWSSDQIPAQERIRRSQQLLGAADATSFGKQFLATRFREMYDDPDRDPERPGPEIFEALRPVQADVCVTELSLHKDCDPYTQSSSPFDQVAIMRIPTAHSYEIPVYLDWGGWNACPSPLEIAAVGRYWEGTHGATLVAMGADKLEFSVTRRPANHAEAVVLLKEHLSFAPDNAELDQDMLEGLAAELQGSDYWFFWWD